MDAVVPQQVAAVQLLRDRHNRLTHQESHNWNITEPESAPGWEGRRRTDRPSGTPPARHSGTIPAGRARTSRLARDGLQARG